MYTIAMRAKTYKQDDLHRFQKKDSVGQRPVIDERESICCRGYAGHEVYGNNSTGAGLYGDTLEMCAFHSMCHGIGTARLTAGAEGPRRTTIPSTVVYIRRTLGDIFIESVRGLDAECDGEILPDEGITRGDCG